MSMINISGIPNLGIPAMGGFPTPNPAAGLNNAQASYANNQAFFDRQAANLGAANAYDPWANSPGGFGAQTAAYAGQGAAFGRATGGFGFTPQGTQAAPGRVGTIGNPGTSNPGYLDSGPPQNSGWGPSSPSGSVSRGPDLANLSPSMPAQPPIPYFGGPGMPFGGGGFSNRGGNVFSTGAPPIQSSPPPGSFSPTPQPQASFANRFAGGSGGYNAFDPGIYAGAAQGSIGRGQPGAAAQPPALTGQPADMSDPDTPSMGGSSLAMRGMNPQAPVPYPFAGGQAFPGAGIGSNQPTNQRDMIAAIMSGSQGMQEPQQAAPAQGFRGAGRDFGATFGQMPQSLEDQLQGILGTIDRAQGQQSPPYLGPPASGNTLTQGDRAIGLRAAGGDDYDPTDPSSTPQNMTPSFADRFTGAPDQPPDYFNQITQGARETALRDAYLQQQQPSSPGFEGVSPSNDYNTFQRGASYPWTQQVPGNDPNIMNAVYGSAGKVGGDPAALAGMINTESRWDPKTNLGKYFGATQMGPDTFKEAGGRLGGMTWGQYKDAPLEKQISAYPDWQKQYNIQGRNEARGLNLGSYDPPTQAALLQGFQFSPNAGMRGTIDWPGAFLGGNTTMNTTKSDQADFLAYNKPHTPPTMQSMIDYYRGSMGR